MTPEERKLLTDTAKTLNDFLDIFYKTNFIDKVVFEKRVILMRDIEIQNLNGVKIGKSADKLGVYGVVPVVQAGAITAPSGGATQDSQARTAIGSIITALKNFGITL